MKTEEVKTIDPNKYIGNDVQTVQAIMTTTKFGPAILMTSEVIPLAKGDTLPEGKDLTASKIFGFSKNPKGELVIAKDGQLDKFLKSKDLDGADIPEFEENKELPMLIGINCKVQKNKNDFLEIT